MRAQQVNQGDRVVVVVVYEGQISIHSAYVVSEPGSHGCGLENDNVHKTLLQDDRRPFKPNANTAQGRYQKSMKVSDPNLLSLDEADRLKDVELAVTWFRYAHPIDVIMRIHFALLDRDLTTIG